MNNDERSLVLERTVKAPVDLVWDALTDVAILKKWRPFFHEFKPEVGFETSFTLGREGGREYVHICEVTELVTHKKLTYSWRYEGLPGDSYVTFELTPIDRDTTKITLTHTITEPFPANNPDFVRRNFVDGWTRTITTLKTFMEHAYERNIK